MDFVEIFLDEIALEGLDGITLPTLWKRVILRPKKFDLSLDDHFKTYIWNHLLIRHKELEFFKLPTPRIPFVYIDRFSFNDEETGVCIEQAKTEDIYPVEIVHESKLGVRGSCSTFKTRVNVTDNVRNGLITYNEVIDNYSESLVIVASQKQRNIALLGVDNCNLNIMNVISDDKLYCFLERIGRSRWQGALTFGNASINTAFNVKPANAFPLRKKLKKYQLITVQFFCMKPAIGISCISGKVLLLTRFHADHTPIYLTHLSMICSMLASEPNKTMMLATAKEKFAGQIPEELFRKLSRLGSKYIRLELRPMREWFPDAQPKDYLTKGKGQERMVKVLRLIQPFVNQDDGGDDDEKTMGDGDDEDACADMDCYGMFPDEFKYPVYLDQSQLSTCYRMIDESGWDGVKGSDFIKRLNIAINDFRTLWRNLERRQCFGSIKVEEGKHRIKKICLSKYKDFHHNQKIIMPDRKSAKLDQSLKSARCSLTTPSQNSTSSLLCSTPVISYPLPSSSFEPFDSSIAPTPEISKQILGDLSIISDVIDNSINANEQNNRPGGSSVVLKFDCSDVETEIEGVSLTATYDTAPTSNDTSIIKPSSLASSKTTNSTTNSAAGSTAATQSHDLSSEETSEYLPLFTDSTSTLRNLMRVRHIMKVIHREIVVYDLNLFKQEIYNAENEKLFTTKSLKRLLKKLADHKKIKVINKTVPEGEFTFYCDLNVEEDGEEVMKVLSFQLLKDRTVSLSSEAQTSLTTTLKIPPLEHRPKFGKAKMVHIYLWSLVYGYNVNESYDFEIPVWLKQVQKIDPHINRSVGWCSMTDAIDNMPLSVFIESILSCSPFDIKGLEEHTSDPNKLHAKLHDIPTEIVRQLTKGRKYLFKFQCTCEVLMKLGLLSFTRCALVKKEEIYMYVHKMASLYDNSNLTTSSSLFPVTDDEGCMMYDFQSLMDIDRYWMALQTLSLDVKSVAPSKPYQTRSNLKEKFRDFINGKDVSEVSDVGFLPGDRLGPGGTDSSLFANLRRNWSLNTEKHMEPGMFTFGGIIDRKPIIDFEAGVEGENRSGQPYSSAETTSEGTSKRGPNVGTKQIRKRGLVSDSKSKPKAKKSKTQLATTENMHDDSAAAPHSKQKRKLCYDEKDEEALRRMTRQRVSWSSQEDRVILLCSLANLFLGNTLKWIVNSTVVRDILHERLECSKNKTAKACLRRKNYLLKKEKVRKNVCVYQAELMHDKELCKEFKENKTYSIYKAKENAEAYIACFCKLEIKFGYNTPENLLEQYSLQLPDTIEELCSKYSIFHPSLDVVKSPKEIDQGDHILFSTLQNLVHSISLLTDKTGRAHELYQMLSGYSSKVLTPVFKHMIAMGIFTRFRPHKNVNANKVVEHQNIGCYQLSQRYQYIWLTVYPKNVFQKAYDFHASFEPRTHDPCHGSKFMNLLAHSSSSIGLCSLLGLNLDIKVKVTVPAEIVVIDSMEQNENELQNNAIKLNRPKNNKDNDENDDDDDEYCNDDEDDDDADMQDIKFSTGNSRTFLYWYRCQYTHSKTSKFIDANNSIFINACQVKVKLPPDYQTVFHSDHKASWVNFYLALDEIKDWNNRHDYIHPKTCQVLLKHLRLTIPGKMDVDVMVKKCKEVVSAATNLDEDDAGQIVTSVYNKIKESSILGTTLPNLLKHFGEEKKDILIRVLKVMLALCLVVRVGIDVFKYVTYDHIEPWTIKIKKNLKGRGVIYNDRPQFNFEDAGVKSRTSANNCPNSKKSASNLGVDGRTDGCENEKFVPVEEDDEDDDDDDDYDYDSSNKITLLKLKNCIMKKITANTQASSSATNSASSKHAATSASSSTTTTATLRTSAEVSVPAMTSVGQISSVFNEPSMPLSSASFVRTLASDHIDTTDREVVDSLYSTETNIASMAGTRTDVNTENVGNAFAGDGTQIDFLISQMPNPASQFCASYNSYSGADVHAAADNTAGRKRKNSNAEERETLKFTKLNDYKLSENIHNPQGSISSCSILFNTTCQDNTSNMNTSSAESNVFTSTFAAPTTSSLLQSPPPCFATLTPVSLSSASSHLLSHFTNQATLCNEEISAEASSITSPSLFSSSAPMISSSSSLNTLCDNKSRARLASVKPLNSNDLSAIIDMFKNVEDTNILSSSSLLEKVVPTSSALSSSSCNRTPPLSPASVLRAPSVLNIFQSSRDSESDCMSSVATFSNTLVNSNNSNHDPITGRIMQFDGANDDGDDEEEEEESERQEEEQEEATVVEGVSFTSKSRHSKRTIKERKRMVDSRVQNDSGPLPRGTYKTVRVIPRPWKTPEGTVNRSSLASMLEAVCLYIAERPGVSTHALTNKYHPVLQPVAVLELLEMLDILGVTTKSYLKPINKPSLFSKRKVNVLGPLSNNPELEMNFVTADFMIKMGQFFNQLHANKRTDDDDDD